MAEILIDTNILIYAYDPGRDDEYASAMRIVEALATRGAGRLSAQVLAEFVSATTRGRRPLLSVSDALGQATRLAEALPVFDVTGLIVLEAARGVRDHRLSYFDAQIWATARLNQVPVIFTEDFSHLRRLEGVQFVNPLASAFDIEQWT